MRFQQRMKVLIYLQIGLFWSLINGHVAAAQKRCHQWWPSPQTILKQFEEWDVIVFYDQLGETLLAVGADWNFKISGDEVDDKN